jgi:hypothetical protein
MEIMMRQFLILVLVPTILAFTGCETTAVRTPTVSNKTAVDYHKSPVRDIAVLPIEMQNYEVFQWCAS